MGQSVLSGKQRVNLIAFHAMSCPDGTRQGGVPWKTELASTAGFSRGVVTKLKNGWFTDGGPGVSDETIKRLCQIGDEDYLAILGHRHKATNHEPRSGGANQSWLRRFAAVSTQDEYVALCIGSGIRVHPALEEAVSLREEERKQNLRQTEASWRTDENAYWHQRPYLSGWQNENLVPMHESEVVAISKLSERLSSKTKTSKTAVVYALPYSGIAHAIQRLIPETDIFRTRYRGGIHHIHIGALEQPDGLKAKLTEKILKNYVEETEIYRNKPVENKISHILSATDSLLVIHGASAIPEGHRPFVKRLSEALNSENSITIGSNVSRLILTVWERGAFGHLQNMSALFFDYEVNVPREDALEYFNTSLEHYRRIRGIASNRPTGPRAESAILKRAEHHYRSKDTSFTEKPSAIRYRAFCASDIENPSPFDPTQGVWMRIDPKWRDSVPEISETLSDIQSDVRNHKTLGNHADVQMLRLISSGLFFVTKRMMERIHFRIQGVPLMEEPILSENLEAKYAKVLSSRRENESEKFTAPLLVRSIIQDDWIRFESRTRAQIHDTVGDILCDMIDAEDLAEIADEIPYQYPWNDSSVVLAVEAIRHFCRASRSTSGASAVDLVRKALDVYDEYLEEGTFSDVEPERGRQRAGRLSRSHGLQFLKYEALCLLSADGYGKECPIGCSLGESATYFRELGITLSRMLRPKDALLAFEKGLAVDGQSNFDKSYAMAHAITACLLMGDLGRAKALLEAARLIEAGEEDPGNREKIRSRNNARAAAIALAQGRRQESTILWRASEDGGMVPFQGDRSIGFFDCLLSSPQLLRSSRLSPANKSIADTTWAAIEHASHTAREQDFEYERLRIDIRKASFARVTGFPKTAEALLDHVGLAIAKHSGAEILFREFQVESAETLLSLGRPRYAFVAYAWPAFQSLRRRSTIPLVRKVRTLCVRLLSSMASFPNEPMPTIASKRFWIEIKKLSDENLYPLSSVDLLPAIADVEMFFDELSSLESRETYLDILRRARE